MKSYPQIAQITQIQVEDILTLKKTLLTELLTY
jgi:hypothetical protein